MPWVAIKSERGLGEDTLGIDGLQDLGSRPAAVVAMSIWLVE